MSPEPDELLTLDEFAAWELGAEEKHEFSAGRVSPFPGGTIEHSAIAGAVYSALRAHLRGGPCRAHGSDIAIRTERSSRYADVVVTCDERDRKPRTTALRFPKLIVEVLSQSTAALDRGEKFDEYRAIASCEEYVLVDSRKRSAESYRLVGGRWISSLPKTQGTLELASVGFALDLDELYDDCGVD
jgi:Uma2 family endonuclease